MKLNENIAITTDNDVIVIQNLQTGDLLVTNEVGGLILEHIEDPMETILSKLKGKYSDVSSQQLEQDATEFLAECQRKGVLCVE